jgi:DNA helicase IV
MVDKQAELQREQTYFDTCSVERERKRHNIAGAHLAGAGPIAAAAELKRAAAKHLHRLDGPDAPAAFGKFRSEDGSVLYVGSQLISTDDRDPLVVNWQTPAAAPYYRATHVDAHGVVVKRQFQTQKNQVRDFEDTVFTAMADQVAKLTAPAQWGIDDTVLRDLDRERSGEMHDIVQTIHAAQYELIRSPLEQLLLIQGGPGTGKTAVALHRVSWLLYNYSDLQPSDVLVIGPNPTFTKYIRSVLPGLGDEDVVHRDLRSLGRISSSGATEDENVARLKGDARMEGLLNRALRQRIRFPERDDTIEVPTSRGTARFTRADVEAELPRYLNSGSYNVGRLGFRGWLQNAASTKRNEVADVPVPGLDLALERVWPTLTPQSFLRDLFASRERLLAAAGDEFTAGEVSRLMRAAADRVTTEQWSDADVALLDDVDELLNGRTHTYAHIVVDEAQDLSPMQLRSVRRRSSAGSMTLVGDLAQSTGPWARDSWSASRSGSRRAR